MSDIVERLETEAPIFDEMARNISDGLRSLGRKPLADQKLGDTLRLAAAEITRLRAELSEEWDKALDEAAEAMESLSFFTDVSDLIGMTKQEMSERTCHQGAQAIRALKSRSHTLSDLIASTADEYMSPKPPIL